MTTPFVSSLRTSMGASAAAATISAPSRPGESKNAMMSLFSGLDLALSESGAVVSTSGMSAAKELLASKNAEKQKEEALAASQALKKQQQKQKQQKEAPVTALSQALGLFDQELEERDSFVSRNKRRQKGSKSKTQRTATSARGRRQRQEKYKHL